MAYKNKEDEKAYKKKWLNKNRAHRNAYMRIWKKKNKTKTKSSQLKSKFGVDLEIYTFLWSLQKGACAICKQPETWKHKNGHTISLAVDHCHKTGLVRGLLCRRHNQAMGNFNDDWRMLKAASDYLKEFHEFA